MKFMLLLCALIVGSGTIWAEDADVTYDFTGNDWSVSNGTLTNGTVSFTGEGGTNFKMNGGYFMMGKNGAYITFPTYSSPVSKIVVTGNSGGSSAVKMNIFVGNDDVSTETQGCTGTNTYDIASGYQDAGTVYTLKVTSNHNAQITKIEVFYAITNCYTVTLSDDENNPLVEASAGAGVTLPTRDAIGSYTFAGWSETNVSTETTNTPTIIPAGAYQPKKDVTLYPVYTKTEGGGTVNKTASVTISDYATANNWSSGTQYTSVVLDDNINATAQGGGNTGKYYTTGNSWRIYSSESGKLILTAANDAEFTSATISFSNSTLSYGGTNITSGTAVSLSGTSAVFTAGGTTYITAISVNYIISGSTTYYWSAPVAAAVEKPVITIAENPFLFSTTATITCATEGATIKYSYDGETWNDYTEALTITETKTIYAKAIKGNDESSVAQVTATKNLAEPTVTISDLSITHTNVYEGTAAGHLTASVKYNNEPIEGATVTWSGDNDAVAKINISSGSVDLVASGTVTFTATFAGNSDYSEKTATYVMNVTYQDPNAPGTEDNPYTVAQAIDAIDNNGNVTAVYVKGIVSQVDSYNGTYHSITYWISEDGTTTNQFEVYSGKGIGGVNFSSINDIQVGDVVVVKGNIKKYNSTYEFDYNNQLVSLQRPVVPTITATETSYTVDAHSYPGTGVLQAVTFTFNEGIATTGDTPFDAYLCDANGNVATYDWINNTYYQGNAQLGIYEIVCTFKDNEETTPRTAYMKIHGKDNDGNDVYSNLVTITQKGQAITRTYRKVTTTAEITSGKYLIVYEYGSVAFDGSRDGLDANGNQVEVEIDNHEIQTDEDIYFTIDLDYGTLKSASGYYIGNNGSSNGLSSSTENQLTNTFSCDFNGNAVITGNGGCALRFNANDSRFRYYKNSGQNAIQLYKEVTDVEKMVISIASACTDGTKCYSTFSSQNPFVVPEGLTVSEVGITDKGTIVVEDYETGATVPAYTGVLVSAAEGGFYEVTVPASQGGSHVIVGEGNRLRPTIVNGYNGITEGTMLENNPNCKFFRLTMQGATATNPGKIGFWYGDEYGGAFDIAGNKAYLAVPASVAGARSGFAFDDETTGISNVNVNLNDNENCYDLQGRKVSKLGKGLYIVNGKKVVIK